MKLSQFSIVVIASRKLSFFCWAFLQEQSEIPRSIVRIQITKPRTRTEIKVKQAIRKIKSKSTKIVEHFVSRTRLFGESWKEY